MKKTLLIVLMLLVAAPVLAIEHQYADEETILGGGVLIYSGPYKGDDVEVVGVPIVVWRYENFFIDGTRAGWVAYEDEEFRFDFYVSPRFMGYDNSDSPDLNGMDDRNASLDAGAQLEWTLPWEEIGLKDLKLTGSVTTDALKEHQGHEARASISKLFKGGIFELTPRAGVKWQSENLVDYYYGVRPSEATAARPTYSPGESWNPFVDVNFNLGLSEEWILVTVFGAEFLDEEIDDSPIVEDDVIFSGVVGVARRF